MDLPGKVVVITGASRGIGRALALALAAKRCKLLLTALEKEELASLAQTLERDQGASVSSMPADLNDDSDRRSLLKWIITSREPPDILVNNAGGGHFGRLEASSWDEIQQTLALNIHAPTFLIRELIPLLRSRPQAKIINISSGIARLPYPALSVYGAAKGFLSSLSESLACELAETNIDVMCFHPGFTQTHFMSSAGMDMSKVPKFLIHTPQATAARIVRAIEKDKDWVYSDAAGRIGVLLAGLLPRKARTRIFRNLFWKVPDEA